MDAHPGGRSQWGSGHTFLVVDFHPETDKVLVLESNAAFRLDGVGFRGLGNLRDVGLQPPADWWMRSEVWTWRRICSTYPLPPGGLAEGQGADGSRALSPYSL
ncbi:hypothetical protein [Corallococcus sp. CA053C]|uniref:hypothetical protein n=1 Tax=Corallococcus sp. CA053C TaxID=2316732 RepID=UPI001F1ADA79|nr:hypothetical protein [Corallococcus sp. CA053C]